jgi:hypothetical protein
MKLCMLGDLAFCGLQIRAVEADEFLVRSHFCCCILFAVTTTAEVKLLASANKKRDTTQGKQANQRGRGGAGRAAACLCCRACVKVSAAALT